MDQRLPDEQTVRAAVALANRAPSIHNTQPWRWVAGDQTLHLFADPARYLPATDPDSRDMVVSCGAALHHLRVAFAALGWGTNVHRLPNPADPDHLAAVELFPSPARPEDIAASAAISKRRTDRRRYGSWPVPATLVDHLMKQATEQGARLVWVADPHDRFALVSAIVAAQQRQTDDDYLVELAVWTGREASSEGVPASNLLSADARYGDVPMRQFPFGRLAQPSGSDDEEDAAELLILSTKADDRLARLRAGEALSAVLLAATEVGMATCPLSQALEVDDTRRIVRNRVLHAAGYPQLVLRIGWAHGSMADVPLTPRRAVDEVLDHLPR